jgi:hypothetical protein
MFSHSPQIRKIIEIWLNLRFISSEVGPSVRRNAQPGVIALLAAGRGAPKQRFLALCALDFSSAPRCLPFPSTVQFRLGICG